MQVRNAMFHSLDILNFQADSQATMAHSVEQSMRLRREQSKVRASAITSSIRSKSRNLDELWTNHKKRIQRLWYNTCLRKFKHWQYLWVCTHYTFVFGLRTQSTRKRYLIPNSSNTTIERFKFMKQMFDRFLINRILELQKFENISNNSTDDQ